LQNRVQELETGIEDLSHSFLSFSNLLIEEQLLSQYPRIAAALQNITQQCVALAKAGSEEPTEVALVHATKKPQIKMAATPDNNTAPSLVLVNTPSETSTDVEDIIRSATRWPGPPTPPYQDLFSLPFGIVMPSPTTELPYVTPPLSNSPTLDLLSNNIVEERQWTIAQRIVQACCQNGYRLLVDTPNHSRVQQIFGSMLGLSERNRLISGFYAATQDKLGDLIEPKANVLTALRSNMNTFSEDQLQLSPRIWQIALESTSGEWMDANGAQRYLRDKRMIFENFTDSSGPDYSVSSSLDVKSFIKCECPVELYHSWVALIFFSPFN
jgi:hypothetical protein